MLSVIIPVLDEAATIVTALQALAPLRARGAEIIVADGGSHDDTAARAAPLTDRVVVSARGRATQMNAGAAVARGDVLLFLHADTRLPPDADRIVLEALARTERAWGRFDVTIEGRHPLLPVVAAAMNARSRLTGITTGDQAMFVTREAFDAAGGFPAIALMEDITFARTLKRISRPISLRARVTTSGRRWETRGVMRTILLMWRLRLMYFLGATPDALARRYGYAPQMRRRLDPAASGAIYRLPGRPGIPSHCQGRPCSRRLFMAWIILLLAGLTEVGWAVGLKYTEGFTRLVPSVLTVTCMAVSLGLLGLALKTLPIGTAYAVWTGIGTIGTALLGIMLFGEVRERGAARLHRADRRRDRRTEAGVGGVDPPRRGGWPRVSGDGWGEIARDRLLQHLHPPPARA